MNLQPGPGSEETNPGNFMSARMIVLNPVSRKFQKSWTRQVSSHLKIESGGSVTIKSNNPFDAPAIDPAFLQNELDILTAREALKRVQRIVAAPVWRDYIIAPTQDLENISQDALDEFIRNSSRTAYHLVGTAAMSPRDANYGVVNPDLLVKGTTGLRIIDASVLVSIIYSLYWCIVTIPLAVYTCSTHSSCDICCGRASCRFSQRGMGFSHL